MHAESEAPDTMDDFVQEEGAATVIHNDNSQTQTGKHWKERLRKYCIGESYTDPHPPPQNPAERRSRCLNPPP